MSNPDIREIYRLREQRQALRDQHYGLEKRNAAHATLKRLEDKMDAIDKELNKLTGKPNSWKKDIVPNQ